MMTYLGSSTFLLYSWKWLSESKPRLSDVERSVVLGSWFAISSVLAYLLNVPLLHTSRYVIARDSVSGMCHSSTRPGTSLHVTQFTRPSPRISTASDKRLGEKAWYEVTQLVGVVSL